MKPSQKIIKLFLKNRKIWMNYLPPTEDNEVYVYPDYGKTTLEKVLKYSDFKEGEVVLWASFTPPTRHFVFHYDQHAEVLTTHGIYSMYDYSQLVRVVGFGATNHIPDDILYTDAGIPNSIDIDDLGNTRFLDKEGLKCYTQSQNSHFGFTFIHGPNSRDDEDMRIYLAAGHVVEQMMKIWQLYEESLLEDVAPFDKNAFLTLPYQDRKMIMPTKGIQRVSSNHIVVFPISESPELSFPIGHPVANQLYVGHPLIPNKYFPFENYQLEFVEDKIREFCEFVQDLGATEITIDCLNSTFNNSDSNAEKTYSGGIKGAVRGVSGSLNTNHSRHLIEELSKTINLHQTFNPTKKPILHPNLIWYPKEPSWQRLYNQRMNGGLLTHEERMETKKSQVFEGRELQDIKAEVQGLFVNLNVGFDECEENKFEQQENAILSIKVEFAPLNELTGDPSSHNTNMRISKNDQEYLNEVKDYIEDYGKIGLKERKYLEKTRMRLGISESRAAELEASICQPKLTDEEKEYLDEVREVRKDYDGISQRERKYLEKTRIRLGISVERANELERM